MQCITKSSLLTIVYSPDVREFFSLDNPKNAETNDDDDQPGADESDSQVNKELNTVEFQKNWLLVSGC